MDRREHLISIRIVRTLAVVLTVLFAAPDVRADITTTGNNPYYVAAGIVNAAAQIAEALAPNTIATIYGLNLSWDIYTAGPSDVSNGELPTELDGVTVLVNGIPCNLFYVSPGQINFLVPYEITTASAAVQVLRQGAEGPTVTVALALTAPAFFTWNGNLAMAEHADGSLITPQSPAQSGEVIVLYAAGLGRTSPDIESGQVVSAATFILYFAQLRILLNGNPCPAANVFYAGLTPGFVGLYQINVVLPENLPANPEIQIAIGSAESPPAVLLPLE